MKGKFFGLLFTDGLINVRVLESVEEHRQEGSHMHHCVFSASYYLNEESLIFSATINGERVETVEFSLDEFRVVQSRGVCNKNTEYHDRIVSLVNSNADIIRQRMKAAVYGNGSFKPHLGHVAKGGILPFNVLPPGSVILCIISFPACTQAS